MTPKHPIDQACSHWGPADAAELYGVDRWGNGYFSLSDNGNVVVEAPCDERSVKLDLMDVIQGMSERGLQMPVLLRIENLLDAQIARLNESFRRAIAEAQYRGEYRGVFPVKVNQQAQVVEEVAAFGARYGHGLEVGSKPELIAALSTLTEPGSLIICNGYKDEEFIDLGLQSLKLGFRCFFVIETPTELPIIIERSRALNIEPLIGVRVKLASKAGGLWNSGSGDRSIFGLTTTQLMQVVDHLKAEGMLSCLQLLHSHLGSQVPNIRDIRTGVMEACRYYIDLVGEGAALEYIDLGGGLAVDYDGSQTNSLHSKNYGLNEYCADIVDVIKGELDSAGIAHPHIVTESGRATVAYTSILLFNILDVTRFEPVELPAAIAPAEHELLHNMQQTLMGLCRENLRESYNDALYYRDQVGELFKHGKINLRSRSIAENLYLEIIRRVIAMLDQLERIPPDLEGLKDSMADIYYGNFSLFQSLPDIWAIDQVFPIMPIHRHQEAPSREAILADITCDCDGKIDEFIDQFGTRKTLPVHPLRDGEEYYLGVFLVGAYQETLGDLHNLFGDANVVTISLDGQGGFNIEHETEADSISEVMSYVEYDPRDCLDAFRKSVERALAAGQLNTKERRMMIAAYKDALAGHTYFD